MKFRLKITVNNKVSNELAITGSSEFKLEVNISLKCRYQ